MIYEAIRESCLVRKYRQIQYFYKNRTSIVQGDKPWRCNEKAGDTVYENCALLLDYLEMACNSKTVSMKFTYYKTAIRY